jgi:hypothetical protein
MVTYNHQLIQGGGGQGMMGNTPRNVPHSQRYSTQDTQQPSTPMGKGPTNIDETHRGRPPWKQPGQPENPGPSPRKEMPQEKNDILSLGNQSFSRYLQPAPYQPGQDNPQPPDGYQHDNHHHFPSRRPRLMIAMMEVKPNASQYQEINDKTQWVQWDWKSL